LTVIKMDVNGGEFALRWGGESEKGVSLSRFDHFCRLLGVSSLALFSPPVLPAPSKQLLKALGQQARSPLKSTSGGTIRDSVGVAQGCCIPLVDWLIDGMLVELPPWHQGTATSCPGTVA